MCVGPLGIAQFAMPGMPDGHSTPVWSILTTLRYLCCYFLQQSPFFLHVSESPKCLWRPLTLSLDTLSDVWYFHWRNLLTSILLLCVGYAFTFLLTFCPNAVFLFHASQLTHQYLLFHRHRFKVFLHPIFYPIVLMLCSAPIENYYIQFLACANCSAAQCVLCVMVEMPLTMSPTDFLF